MRSASKRLKAYQDGDRLDDDELEALAAEMGALADLCFVFGDIFRLQGVYAEKVRRDCTAFLNSRRLRATTTKRSTTK